MVLFFSSAIQVRSRRCPRSAAKDRRTWLRSFRYTCCIGSSCFVYIILNSCSAELVTILLSPASFRFRSLVIIGLEIFKRCTNPDILVYDSAVNKPSFDLPRKVGTGGTIRIVEVLSTCLAYACTDHVAMVEYLSFFLSQPSTNSY